VTGGSVTTARVVARKCTSRNSKPQNCEPPALLEFATERERRRASMAVAVLKVAGGARVSPDRTRPANSKY